MTRMISDVGNFEGDFHLNKNGPNELSFHGSPVPFYVGLSLMCWKKSHGHGM